MNQKPDKPQNHDPNLVSKRFLAELVGQPVTVRVSAEWSVTGRLVRFDNYCLILSLPDQPEVIIFKGPGVTVSKATELCK